MRSILSDFMVMNYFGVDESGVGSVDGRPFIIVLAYSTDISDISKSVKLRKKRYFDSRIIATPFIYCTGNPANHLDLMTNLVIESMERFCHNSGKVFLYLDGSNYGKKLSDIRPVNSSKLSFSVEIGGDRFQPIVNRADHLAYLISLYKSTNHIHLERKESFKQQCPNIEERLAECELVR